MNCVSGMRAKWRRTVARLSGIDGMQCRGWSSSRAAPRNRGTRPPARNGVAGAHAPEAPWRAMNTGAHVSTSRW